MQENILSAKSNNLYGWWDQTTREAEQMKRKPALVFKKDRGKPIIMVEEIIETLTRFTLNSNLGETPINASLYLFEDWLRAKSIQEIILV